jgi:Ala-tRNA(Pro) deacylase
MSSAKVVSIKYGHQMPNRFGPSFSRQIPERLISCLNEGAVRYEILHEPSAAAGPGRRSAIPGLIETAVVRAGNQRFLAVTPTGYDVDLKRFAGLIREPVRLETEDEFKWLFPDCALGAIPPFGNLYGLTTWVDNSLLKTEHIVFFAGTLIDSIKLSYSAYEQIVQPNVGTFTNKRRQ